MRTPPTGVEGPTILVRAPILSGRKRTKGSNECRSSVRIHQDSEHAVWSTPDAPLAVNKSAKIEPEKRVVPAMTSGAASLFAQTGCCEIGKILTVRESQNKACRSSPTSLCRRRRKTCVRPSGRKECDALPLRIMH
mgnify:CR=1 FL=1|jgi:hypothetical protein